MWVFVLGDLIIFGTYFVIFMVERSWHRDVFLESQRHLNLGLGAVNTLVLLTSSRFVAQGVRAARRNDNAHAVRLVLGGGLCGVLFLAIKSYEWASEIAAGHTLATNTFFTFYFMLTGVHLFHVVLGLVILGVVVADLKNPELRRVSTVEAGATYWHLVDLLWVVIFALFYVLR